MKNRKTEIISHVNRSLERIGCTRRIEKEVIAKDWDMLTEEDFAQIQNSGYQIESFSQTGRYRKGWIPDLIFYESESDRRRTGSGCEKAVW